MTEQFVEPMHSLFQAFGHNVPNTIARTLQVQLLHPSAKLPTRGSEHAAGLDLYAASWMPYGESMIQYDTGVAVAIPEGYVGLLIPRSSVTGTSLRLANSCGVLDPDFRGSIKFRFDALNLPDSEPNYGIGDRIGQLVIVPAPRFEPIQVDELPATTRGEGSFGSSGR